MQQDMLELEVRHADRKQQAKARANIVHRYFKKPALSLAAAKKKATKAPRYFPAKNAKTKDATAWLLKYLPETMSLKEDDLNARWYLINKTSGVVRSVSWTRRGHAKACSEVLQTAWTFHYEESGVMPEFDMEELVKDLEEHVLA